MTATISYTDDRTLPSDSAPEPDGHCNAEAAFAYRAESRMARMSAVVAGGSGGSP